MGFINQMIDESQIVGNRCSYVRSLLTWWTPIGTEGHEELMEDLRWYTSLAGRYSSLPKVVTKLQSLKVSPNTRAPLYHRT